MSENGVAIQVNKVRDIGDIINDTFRFIRYNYKKYFLALLFLGGPFLVIATTVSYIPSLLVGTDTSLRYLGITFLFTMIGFIINIIALTILQIIPVKMIIYYKNGDLKNYTINRIWDDTKKDIWMIVLTNFVIGILVGFALLLLIIPGIYLMIILILVPIIRIIERCSLGTSLSRSTDLIKNYWWFTFALGLLIFISYFALSMILSLPNLIVTYTTSLHQTSTGETSVLLFILSYFFAILSQLSSIISAISTTALTFHYFNLVERKEATGLWEKVDKLGTVNEHSSADNL